MLYISVAGGAHCGHGPVYGGPVPASSARVVEVLVDFQELQVSRHRHEAGQPVYIYIYT